MLELLREASQLARSSVGGYCIGELSLINPQPPEHTFTSPPPQPSPHTVSLLINQITFLFLLWFERWISHQPVLEGKPRHLVCESC